MTFEERLEGLIERQQKLTLKVEATARASRENTRNIEKLAAQIADLTLASDR